MVWGGGGGWPVYTVNQEAAGRGSQHASYCLANYWHSSASALPADFAPAPGVPPLLHTVHAHNYCGGKYPHCQQLQERYENSVIIVYYQQDIPVDVYAAFPIFLEI
jgi:hypothetical protein